MGERRGTRHTLIRRRAACRGIAGPAPWASRNRSSALLLHITGCVGEGGEACYGVGRGRHTGPTSRSGKKVHKLAAGADGEAAHEPFGMDDNIAWDTPSACGPLQEGQGRDMHNSWIKERWRHAMAKIKKEPLQILTIPVSAAFVGWVTNKLAVEMIFHPLVWRGLPLRVVEGQPFGLIGWQGIVPAKAGIMAERLVDMVTTQLLDVQEVFGRLSPGKIARLLGPEIDSIVQEVYEDLTPRPLAWVPGGIGRGLPYQAVDELKGLRRGMLVGLTRDMQKRVHEILDVKDLVVGEMLRDRSLMVSLFQRCGKAEFKFLVNSGFFFGFLLGVVQMFVWILYDKPWTLPAGGAVVGYITNWLAIKLIFEPVDPFKIGPFVVQGLFLKRQNEVSADFAEFFSKNVLTSNKLWKSMLDGCRADAFRELVSNRVVPFISKSSAVAGANLDPLTVKTLAARATDKLRDHVHVLHEYTDKTLALRETMTVQMQKMSTRTFEGVLHPVFQEEEFILIVAGAILGAVAGFLQMLLSTKSVRKAARVGAAKAAETAAAAADGVVGAGGELVGGVVGGRPAQVAQAAQKRASGWKQRAAREGKRCASSVRDITTRAYASMSTAGRAAAAAIADRYRRCRRRKGTQGGSAVESCEDRPDARRPESDSAGSRTQPPNADE